jgi:hypothetical protein
MCSRGDFSTAIIDAREVIKIEIRAILLERRVHSENIASQLFAMLLKSEIMSVARVFQQKTLIATLAFSKISSPMLSGDFGSTVVCA